MRFPIDLGAFERVVLHADQPTLSAAQRDQLQRNVQLCRDALIFFTAVADAKGLGGHTGGPYDIVPEVLIADGLIHGSGAIVPVFFDEAGHRVAIQYLMSVLLGHMPAERLLHYRESESKLPGHPERGLTPGLEFSSGRLGHMWPYANGVAMAHPDKAVLLFGSDGSQMEGNDAEAARLCVAHGLAVKLVIDDNDVTISGHPSRYMPGFDVARTLAGHGLPVDVGEGEDLTALHTRMCRALQTKGPVALVNKRKMAPGVTGIEGSPKAHDVVKVPVAAAYLAARGLEDAVSYLKSLEAPKRPTSYRGVAAQAEWGKNRETFGMAVVELIGEMTGDQRARAVRVFDNDLEGSCGLAHVKKAFPQLYVQGGVMERGNYSAAAGFGMERGRQGVFATFSAFQEMLISEITMARLNDANVLAHFSHAGVDDMADNTCHFGVNNFFADNGLPEGDHTRLYFPGDQHQMRAVVRRVFGDPGLRFVYSTRSPVPDVLGADGKPMFAGNYRFEPGKDELIREGKAGYVVSYGEMLFRALDAVEQLREQGLDVGLVNKPTLNVIDEAMLARVGKSPFVLLVESQNRNTGLGIRYGTWLLARGLAPRYDHLGTTRSGSGGLWEQMPYQGLDPASIVRRARELAATKP
jgi:transketolase